MRSLFNLSLFALSLFTAATVAEPHAYRRQHDSLARRVRGDLQQRSFDNARFTFYDVGLGACGSTNVPSDFIVALNTPQFGSGYPGPNCFKMITISYNGKTTGAQIMDECPGCPYGGLDMSTGLFQFFAAESVGVLYGTWSFNDDAGGGTPATTTTSTTKPEPTTSYTPDPTTSTTPVWTSTPVTWQPSPSSSKSSSESKQSSSTPTPTPTPVTEPKQSPSSDKSSATPSASNTNTIDFSSGPAKGLADPAGTVDDNEPQGILSINKAIVGLAGIVVAGHGL